MMTMVTSLKQEEERLLHVITLFQGPTISEAVVQLFLMYTKGDLEEGLEPFGSRRQTLEVKNLVQVETEYLLTKKKKEDIHRLTEEDFGEYDEGATRTEDIIFTNLRIHNLLQGFILETNKDSIDEITSFLNEKWNFLRWGNIRNLDFSPFPGERWKFFRRGDISHLHVTTLLCALFGVKSVKEKAMEKIGDSSVKSRCVDICKAAPLALATLVSLMAAVFKRRRSRENSDIGSAVTKVFWTLLVDGKLDDENISLLLRKQECRKGTLIFLEELGSTISGVDLLSKNRSLTLASSTSIVRSREGRDDVPNITFYLPRAVYTLVTLGSPDVERWSETRALVNLFDVAMVTGSMYYFHLTCSMLRRIISFVTTPSEMEGRRVVAARAVWKVVMQVGREEMSEVDFMYYLLPDLQELLELLTNDVFTRTQWEVRYGLRSVVHLLVACIQRYQSSLRNTLIREIEGVVGTVVQLLASEVEQKRCAAMALVDVLFNCFRLSDDTFFPRAGIGRVASSRGWFEATVRFIIGMLSQRNELVGDRNLTEQSAIRALCLIAMFEEVQIVERLAKFPGLLKEVVIRLSERTSNGVCLDAATFVRLLSTGMRPSMVVSLVQEEGCLETLARLLDDDVEEDAQTEALRTLISLSKSNDIEACHRILETHGLLEKIVVFFTDDREILMSKIFSTSFCRKVLYRRRYFRNLFHLRSTSEFHQEEGFVFCPFEDLRGLKASLFASLIANPRMRGPLKSKLVELRSQQRLGAHVLRAIEFALVVILDEVETSESIQGGRERSMVHVVDGTGTGADSDPDSLFWASRREFFGGKDFCVTLFNSLVHLLSIPKPGYGPNLKHDVIERPPSLELSPLFLVCFQVGVLSLVSFVFLFLPPWDSLSPNLVLVKMIKPALGTLYCSYAICATCKMFDSPVWYIATNWLHIIWLLYNAMTILFFPIDVAEYTHLGIFRSTLLVGVVLFVAVWDGMSDDTLGCFLSASPADGVVFVLITFLSGVRYRDHGVFMSACLLIILFKTLYSVLFSFQVWTPVCVFVFSLIYIWWPRVTRWIREVLFGWALRSPNFLLSFIGTCDFFLDAFGFFLGAFLFSFLGSKLIPIPWTVKFQNYWFVCDFLLQFVISSLLDIVFPCPVKFVQIFSFAVGLSISCSWFPGSPPNYWSLLGLPKPLLLSFAVLIQYILCVWDPVPFLAFLINRDPPRKSRGARAA